LGLGLGLGVREKREVGVKKEERKMMVWDWMFWGIRRQT